MSNEVKNPYVAEIDPDQRFALGKTSCWVVVYLFLATILVPPIYRNVKDAIDGGWVPVKGLFQFNPDDPETPTLAHHLRAVEAKIDKADFRDLPRRALQSALTRTLREGNVKAFVGRDGWLFFRPAITALTGYGPLKPEPPSPMKDPTVKPWSPALPVIEKFAAQLKERGIDLLLVPVPVKPMIYPEMIDGRAHSGPVRHRDAEAFYAKLRAAGVDVLDLADAFWLRKLAGHQVFLKQDTHWTAGPMQEAARLVADHIKAEPYSIAADDQNFGIQTVSRNHIGDLVEKQLDLAASGLFEPESQELSILTAQGTEQPPGEDPLSPITLLGDSFVNIFDDPSIGFGDPTWKPADKNDAEPLIGAGFRRHLAKELGTPLDVIAQNGGAATAVRVEFAKKPNNIVRAKKLVVWVIASRDLFLSETPARAADVVWSDVENWNPNDAKVAEIGDPKPGGFIATATLVDKAPFADPKVATYKDSLYACLYRIENVEKGTFEGDELLVWQWAFRNKKLEPTSRFEVGKKYRLNLSPWDSKTSLKTINQSTKPDLDRFDLIPYFVEEAEPAG